jgi:hypothetical protein
MAAAVPAYILVWLTSAYLSGGYDQPVRTSRVVRGIFVGTLLISAASNFLDAWRFSKALIILGGAWAVAALVGRQLLTHFIRYKNLRLSERRQKNIAIVGSGPESRRVRQLLEAAQVSARVIGYVRVAGGSEGEVSLEAASHSPVHPFTPSPNEVPLGELRQLADIIRLYALNELIFCGKDLPASQIIGLMLGLPADPPVAYKILPEDSQYIIGSSSKDSPGDYYTLDIALNLYQPQQARAKRLLDLLTSATLLLLSPLLVWGQPRKAGFLRNCADVLLGRRTWVGLRYTTGPARTVPAVVSPADAANSAAPLNDVTLRRLELLYAKDYEPGTDLTVLWRCRARLGDR